MAEPEFNIKDVKAALEDADESELQKLLYDVGERGWALDVGDGRALIANVPFTPRLHLWDVVEVTGGGDGSPAAGRVLWRAYEEKTEIRYPHATDAEAKHWYKAIWNACDAADLAVEGRVDGWCGVMHHEHTDLGAVLRNAGIDTAKLKLEPGGGT